MYTLLKKKTPTFLTLVPSYSFIYNIVIQYMMSIKMFIKYAGLMNQKYLCIIMFLLTHMYNIVV